MRSVQCKSLVNPKKLITLIISKRRIFKALDFGSFKADFRILKGVI